MTKSRDIRYIPHRGVTAESELDVLARIYRYLLDRKKAAPASRPDDPERSPSDRARDIMSEKP